VSDIPDQITELAYRLLEFPLDPIPRYRVMRDILHWPENHPDMLEIREKAMNSRAVGELCRSQREDGSWGRFYTRNKQVKYAGRTTETALIRALALGMDRSHPAIQKLVTYLEAVISGQKLWPDHTDKTLEWPASMKLVTAARLLQIDHDHKAAGQVADLWRKIMAERTPPRCRLYDSNAAPAFTHAKVLRNQADLVP
jgi:hypothetical protein